MIIVPVENHRGSIYNKKDTPLFEITITIPNEPCTS